MSSAAYKKDYYQLHSDLRKTGYNILFNNPLLLIKASSIGILKAHISHVTHRLAKQLGMNWYSIDKLCFVKARFFQCFQKIRNKDLYS